MSRIEINPQQIVLRDDPIEKLSELLLLFIISDRERTITFKKRNSKIDATGLILNDKTIPIDCFIFGRLVNHYRKLFQLDYPSRANSAIVTTEKGSAKLDFKINKSGDESVIEFNLRSNQIDPVDRPKMIDQYYDLERQQMFFAQRWWLDFTEYADRCGRYLRRRLAG